MATYTNAYDRLYNNMKNAFTVVNDNCESTLGEYMIRHARAQRGTNLPATTMQKDNAIAALYSYVNDKLTIKTPPAKDKTIKAFPIRSCAAALLSAVVVCTVVLSYGNFIGADDKPAYVIETEADEDLTDTVQAADVKND